jgi:hypothetical protein
MKQATAMPSSRTSFYDEVCFYIVPENNDALMKLLKIFSVTII